MTKLKKCLTILLGVIMLFSITCFFVGCDKTDDGETKCDVMAKVVATRGGTQIGEWIFTPDIDELTAEFEYTGERIFVNVTQLQTIGHKHYDGKWLTHDNNGAIKFKRDTLYSDPSGKQDVSITQLVERGKYIITFRTVTDSGIVKYRRYRLTVTIK